MKKAVISTINFIVEENKIETGTVKNRAAMW